MKLCVVPAGSMDQVHSGQVLEETYKLVAAQTKELGVRAGLYIWN